MKSLPIALDRMLANPSFERIDGKLIKVSDDRTRIILELKGKKLRTLMGPFADTDWPALFDKMVIAFYKQGEVIRVFDAKQIPREQKAPTGSTRASSTTKRGSSPKGESNYAPKVKWKKYAEGRMIGEPVKLSNMEKGFDLDMNLILRIFKHLEIVPGAVTKVISYADFRKFFHFLCDPSFRNFLNGQPMPAPKPKAVVEDDEDEDDDDAEEAPAAKPVVTPPTRVERDFRSGLSKFKKSSSETDDED